MIDWKGILLVIGVIMVIFAFKFWLGTLWIHSESENNTIWGYVFFIFGVATTYFSATLYLKEKQEKTTHNEVKI